MVETIWSVIRYLNCGWFEGVPDDYENAGRSADSRKSRHATCWHASPYPLYLDGVGKLRQPRFALARVSANHCQRSLWPAKSSSMRLAFKDKGPK
jgi:hypothetical protein